MMGDIFELGTLELLNSMIEAIYRNLDIDEVYPLCVEEFEKMGEMIDSQRQLRNLRPTRRFTGKTHQPILGRKRNSKRNRQNDRHTPIPHQKLPWRQRLHHKRRKHTSPKSRRPRNTALMLRRNKTRNPMGRRTQKIRRHRLRHNKQRRLNTRQKSRPQNHLARRSKTKLPKTLLHTSSIRTKPTTSKTSRTPRRTRLKPTRIHHQLVPQRNPVGNKLNNQALQPVERCGMDLLQSITLGLIQGTTEWLPISSTGHLRIAEYFFGLTVPLLFDVLLHFGTLLVTLIYLPQ